MSDYENWNDEYRDDIESQGMPLIRQGQSNSPKVLEGVLGIGDFLMPNGLVTKAYQFIAIGCEDLWVHWGANRNGGRLGFLPGSEIPPGTEWLKPGVPRDGWPNVMKEGRYAADGSVWERTYLPSLAGCCRRPAGSPPRPADLRHLRLQGEKLPDRAGFLPLAIESGRGGRRWAAVAQYGSRSI
jgi:hypothetical protein